MLLDLSCNFSLYWTYRKSRTLGANTVLWIEALISIFFFEVKTENTHKVLDDLNEQIGGDQIPPKLIKLTTDIFVEPLS